MIIDQRYLGQEELKYVYEHGKKRMEYHPELAEKYRKLASNEKNVIFGGRLAEYKYYDMDDVIKSAFDTFKTYDK